MSVTNSFAKGSSPSENKKVGVICSTYRDPSKPSLTRLYGISSLIEQVMNQNFDGDIRLFIVDDSPEPHPFLVGLGEKLKDRVFYFHTPERNNLSNEILTANPEASKFFPKDEDFANNSHWKDIIRQVEDWKRFLPFDYEFAKNFAVDMTQQVLAPRPTIGMKKNFACGAYQEHFGELPDVFVYVDDDDFRSPDYIQTVVEGIEGANFARMTKTYVHNFSENTENQFWGEIDFQPQQDGNGNWYLPNEIMDSECYKFQSGEMISRPVSDLYSRNLLLSWPIISHDGALHNYTGETWGRAVEEFGGFLPTSFSEDIITHKMMEQLTDFKTKKIEVTEPKFLRCSDGRNASDFYLTKIMAANNMPKWVLDSVEPMYSALSKGRNYSMHSEKLYTEGVNFGKNGQLKIPRTIKPQVA